MARFSRITKKLIAVAVVCDDLNQGLCDFQNAIGIDSGDVAGVVFTGDWEREWPIASQERRQEMMAHYIHTERCIAAR